MKKRVFKYKIPVDDYVTLELPKGYQILSVGCQGRTPVLWALIDDSETEKVNVNFRLAGTGHAIDKVDMPADYKFIGTFNMLDTLWFHLFEIVL